ncbi:MAG: glycosyltransferase [Pseudomonadota bacterium]
MKVMIVVTHLLGTGHLSRALTLGRAYTAAGHRALIVSGGFPAPQLDTSGVELVTIPALRSDGTNFTRLMTETGLAADAAFLANRQRTVLQILSDYAPDVLITELFPFGRRVLKSEFQALLQAAVDMASRPLVLCSIRDILAPPSKPSKSIETVRLVQRFFDGVLVHSDPQVTTLDASWPVNDALADKLRYTGFVAPDPADPHPDGVGTGEILVSAGGGAVGGPIFRCAIEASRLMPNRHWRLLVGGRRAEAEAEIKALAELAITTPVTIEPARPDFRQILCNAAASISMCGYNTAMDLLQTGVPAVVVPFDAGSEVEQGLRADALSALPGLTQISSADLSPQILVDALQRVLHEGSRTASDFSFDGAFRSVQITQALLEGAR